MGRLASTWLDLVVGLDLHLQIVLRPPLPPFVFIFPHPYIGLVIDPIGLAFSVGIGSAISLASGGGVTGPVLVNGLPVTTAGTESIGLPVLHWPYMGQWLPFPRPKPPVRPGKPMKPPLAIPPNDAIVLTGSKTVHALGASMSAMGDIALSCSDPIPLPLSFIIAIPKGAPVLVGGPVAIDFMAAAFGILKSQFITRPLRNFLSSRFQRLASRIRNSRLRNLWDDALCFFTGHPVDVATGRMVIRALDWHIRGPSGLSFERRYSSNWCDRPSPLGHGWTHNYDEAVWTEPYRVVLRRGDGREIEIDTEDLGAERPGSGELFEPLSRLWLKRTEDGWEVRDAGGERRRYRPLSAGDTVARLVRIETRGGLVTRLAYEDGRLTRIHDPFGRAVQLVHDDAGRIVEIRLPHARDEGACQTQTRYVYSPEGDLAEVHSGGAGVTRYAYQDHLLVQETDANGKSFYFGYDGRHSDAYCVRTWGDDGLFDEVLDYDKERRITRVHDSRGARTTYVMNELFAVTEVVDDNGAKTTFTYDDNMWLRRVRDAVGEESAYEHDARGYVIAEVLADGSREEREYDDSGRLVRLVDRRGGVWKYRLGPLSMDMQMPDETVTRFVYDDRGLLLAVIDPAQKRWSFDRDAWGNIVRYTDSEGRTTKIVHDRLGRALVVDGDAGRTTLSWGLHGYPERIGDDSGAWEQLRYDGEGNVVERETSDGTLVRYAYNAANHVVRVTSRERSLDIRRDSEGLVLELALSDGRSVCFTRDLLGRVIALRGLDGIVHRLRRDDIGRVVASALPDGSVTRYEYGRAGRDVRVTLPDGQRQTFELDALGLLVEASNSVARVRFERDALGRIVKEWCDDDWIESGYDRLGRRESVRDVHGFALSISYDDEANVATLFTPGGTVTVEHDENGLERRRTFFDSVSVRWHRDPGGRPLERIVRRDEEIVSQRAYSWTDDGRLAGWREGDRGAWIERDANGDPGAVKYGDGTVDVRRLDDRGQPHGAGGFRYDDGGRVLEAGPYCFEWNEIGQLELKRHRDGTFRRYWYDSAGRLTEVIDSEGGMVRYRYDALGRLRERIAGDRHARWRWDGEQVLEQSEGAGVARRWVVHPATAVPLAELTGAGMRGAVTDDIGTLQALVDASGAIVWQGDLDLFGRARERGAAPSLRFPGQWADDDLGLHYNHHRFYDPDVGRYITPDPIGLRGGLDPYAYVADPFEQADPLGLARCTIPRVKPGSVLPEGHFVHWTTREGLDGMLDSGQIRVASRPHKAFVFFGTGHTIPWIQGGSGIYVTRNTNPSRWYFSPFLHGTNPSVARADVRIGVIIDARSLDVRWHVPGAQVIKGGPVSSDLIVGVIEQVVR